MQNLWVAVVVAAAGFGAFAQQPPAVTQDNVAGVLRFEGPLAAGGLPQGWHAPGPPLVSLDLAVKHNGKRSLRIERTSASPNDFTPASVVLPVDFVGHTVELRGSLRVAGVNGYAALWLRADNADGSTVAFDTSAGQSFQGTREWQPVSVSITLNDQVSRLQFGVLLNGTGTAWADDLELLIDGKPAREAATRPRAAPTVLDRDKEFSSGSRLHLDAPTERQVENLATLAELWGFLKYHHPAVTSGQHNWDFDLFRVLPNALAANTTPELNAVLLAWIDGLGPIAKCSPCAAMPHGQLRPDLAWLNDRKRFGPALASKLRAVYSSRPTDASFFIAAMPRTNNPVFQHEPTYSKIAFPDSGYQLLTLFRWWNAIEYWYPDRAQLPDLHRTLRAYIRPIALAKTKDQFTIEIMNLIGEARDTHANLWSSMDVRPPAGPCAAPVALRHIDSSFVVWDVRDAASGLQRGDVIESLDGHRVDELAAQWSPFYDDSNPAARWRDLSHELTNGPCGPLQLEILRNGQALQRNVTRTRPASPATVDFHDHPGDAFRMLSDAVAYLDLGSSKIADIPGYIERAQHTRGMVLDLRDYPVQFMVFALGQSLVAKPIVFARLTAPDLANPGAFDFVPDGTLQPQLPHYAGRIVILVDETSQSQAEYTAMAMRAAPGAVVVGSQTAGADGNVSTIPLPFGMSTMISGLGVYTPQGHTTQQVGIARDIEAVPTIAGIAAGRDEVLEIGIRQILGSTASQADVERMAHR